MIQQVHKDDRVETKDGRFLGTAFSLHYRQHDINFEADKHTAYLKVWHKAKGSWLFIPVLYIESIEPASQRLSLSLDFATVQSQAWGRLPDFIANAQDIEVELDRH